MTKCFVCDIEYSGGIILNEILERNRRQKEEVVLIKGNDKKVFPSYAEASTFLGVAKQSVSNAAKLGTHSGGWRVVSARTPKTESEKRHKSVVVVSNTDELTFSSVKEAAQFLGIAESTLRTNIRKGYTIKKQYIARYGE